MRMRKWRSSRLREAGETPTLKIGWAEAVEPEQVEEPVWHQIKDRVKPAGRLLRRNHGAEHEQDVASAAGDHEEVKEIMCSQNARERNRPARKVDDRPHAVNAPPTGSGKSVRCPSKRASSR